jgi:hypothetical protein
MLIKVNAFHIMREVIPALMGHHIVRFPFSIQVYSRDLIIEPTYMPSENDIPLLKTFYDFLPKSTRWSTDFFTSFVVSFHKHESMRKCGID